MNIGKCVLPLIAATCVLFAQTDRGSIEGTVKDPNGAIVPAAKVQVVNIETNSRFDFESSEVGHYLAANLPVGSYRLVIQKEGFRTVVREPILVSAQSNLAADITLQLGAVTDTVTVTGESPLLDVSATANPSNLPSKFIDDLPMIVFGEKRNITDNLRFLPGNTSSSGSLGSGEAAESWSGRVNSAVQGATEIFIDGAPSSEFSTRRGSVLENGPVVETVAEYTVVANAFNAEYGGFGSWFTTVTLKSGANTVHGKVYDYFGNDKLNARSFFQGPVKQKLRQNEGGFQVGGPIYIPKIYDGRNKTFLFFSQGLYYARLGGAGGLQTVPRNDFKAGDFSNFLDATGAQIPIFDPQSTKADGNGSFVRTQFPGNVIPASRISPVSAKIVALLPKPDLTSQTNNWYNRTGAYPCLQHLYVHRQARSQLLHQAEGSVDVPESVAPAADQQQRLGKFRQRGDRPALRTGRAGRLPAADRYQPDLASEPRLHFQPARAQPPHHRRGPLRQPLHQYQRRAGLG